MSDNHWWFLVLILALVIVGLKVFVWLLALAFLYWLIKTGFEK